MFRFILKVVIVISVFASLLIFVFGIFRFNDASMKPSFRSGDLIVFFKLDKSYTQDDVVVMEYDGKRQIRRVVAVEGDVIDFTAEGMTINGALILEHDIYEETLPYSGGITYPVTIGKNQVFVLGDGRRQATDSRVYGPVDENATEGRVMTVLRRRNF